jgi:2-octaprenyl-6-methoxyphenol hydroxylase
MYYDLVIVGGGMVGSSLAVALQHTSLRIALIDARIPGGQDERLFALNYGSCQFLSNLGLWSVLKERACPIYQVHVSKQKQFGAVRLRKQDVDLSELGHVIPARDVEALLQEKLCSLPQVTLYRPATLIKLQQADGQVNLQLEVDANLVAIEAGMVIGADGAASTVRQQLGIEAEKVDYQQTAIVTRTLLQRSHQHVAYERFTHDGAIAMLPLQNDQCATILTVANATAEKWMALSDANFLQTLQSEFGYRLGRFKAVTKRFSYPLQMIKAKHAVSGQVLLLGNAAHTFHPIAAQGFNLALYEVAVLAEILLAEKNPATADLAAVSAKTQRQQATSMGVSHQLAELFAADSKWLSLMTQFGMVGLDVLTPVKKYFMQRILGRTGEVPQLFLDRSNYDETI